MHAPFLRRDCERGWYGALRPSLHRRVADTSQSLRVPPSNLQWLDANCVSRALDLGSIHESLQRPSVSPVLFMDVKERVLQSCYLKKGFIICRNTSDPFW